MVCCCWGSEMNSEWHFTHIRFFSWRFLLCLNFAFGEKLQNKICSWLFCSDSIRVKHCLWHQKGTSSRTRCSFSLCSFYILFEKQSDSFCKSIIKTQSVMFSLSFSRQNWYGKLYCKTWGRKGNLDVWSKKLRTEVSTRMLMKILMYQYWSLWWLWKYHHHLQFQCI